MIIHNPATSFSQFIKWNDEMLIYNKGPLYK